MRRIIEKHTEKVLPKEEREKFYAHKFKVDMARMFGNGILGLSVYKLITLPAGDAKWRTL